MHRIDKHNEAYSSDQSFENISIKSAQTEDEETFDLSDEETENFNILNVNNWNAGRKKVEGAGKWRDGPIPPLFDISTSEATLEIGSLDANILDVYGQTLMHEVAREWHVDVAKFLKVQGVEIDRPDNYGRTPLFVAVSSDHVEMVTWLIQSGADIFRKCNLKQMVIHYAAFYNSIESMKVLVDSGVHPNVADSEQQTPLFIAAKKGNLQVCNYLLGLNVPTACYTLYGSTATEQTIMNCSKSIALKCLDQYRIYYTQSSLPYDYISHFTKLRWHILSKHKNLPIQKRIYPNVLETIVEKNDMEMIMHPVISKLLSAMMRKFGRKYLYINVFLNIMYTLCWSISVSLHKMNEELSTVKRYNVLLFGGVGSILGLLLLIQISYDSHKATKTEEERQQRLIDKINERLAECHPRWSVEKRAIEKEMETVILNPKSFWDDRWTIVDLFCLLLTFVYVGLEIPCLLLSKSSVFCKIRGYYSVFFLIVLWIRLNRCLQILESLGGFISCFRYCLLATVQFAFLYLEFMIPLFCAFWVLFGGSRKDNVDGDSEYRKAYDMFYQLYLLTVVGDYEYGNLKKINEAEAQFLVGLYILLISIVCLNLYIALLSEAFVRVHSLAIATARINQAKALLSIERIFPSTIIRFEEHLMNNYTRKENRLQKLHKKSSDVFEDLKKISSSLNMLQRDATDMLKQDLLPTIQNNQEILSEVQAFGKNYTGETTRKNLDDMFDILADNKSNLFQVQRKTKRRYRLLRQRAIFELPIIVNEYSGKIKKAIGVSGEEESEL